MPILRRFALKLAVFCLASYPVAQSAMAVTPFLPQSFFFDWNPPGQALPIPVTEQCQTIHITWSRGTATGPNNVGPYYLQVYTSIYPVPIVIPVGNVFNYDWAVPFPPNTLYQICMFDSFGNTGGCQATYTVIASNSTPTCANVTINPQLGVSAIVDNGPISPYGWIDQCTDISITPTNGTPPFTLTIAPALHPPYNITSPDNRPINWTVSLSWASQFFISLVDANGNMWANGPQHSGGGGTIACLAGNATDHTDTVTVPVVIGTGVGGLAIGLIVGVLVAYIFLRHRIWKKVESRRFVDISSSAPGTPQGLMFDRSSGPGQYRPLPTASSSGGISSALASHPSSMPNLRSGTTSQYHVEPFIMPDEQGRLRDDAVQPAQSRIVSTHESIQAPSSRQNQVYIVHHDSQVPPVTIYHENGTQIVELPPRYPPFPSPQSEVVGEGRSASDSRSDGTRTDSTNEPPALQQQRRPTQIRKPTAPRSS